MGAPPSSEAAPPELASPGWRTLGSPRWVLSHAAVVALVIAMLAAGFWQINRHRERAERNDLVAARALLEPVEVTIIATTDSPVSVGLDEQFRRVVVTGTYRVEDEVLVRNRTFDGAPGWWVLTPLVTEQGFGVAVNRGWIPRAFNADEARPGTETPAGVVTVVGTVQPTRTAEGFQVADPDQGRLTSMARTDIARLGDQLDYELLPLVVQLSQSGADQDLPVTLPLPALDSGPHASYAVQWFIFSTIALIGYPLILRRVAGGSAGSYLGDDEPTIHA